MRVFGIKQGKFQSQFNSKFRIQDQTENNDSDTVSDKSEESIKYDLELDPDIIGPKPNFQILST